VDTVQGLGVLDCRLMTGSARVFDWYNEETVTELETVDCDGRVVRLAVSDRDRRVLRSGYMVGGRLVEEPTVNLYLVAGLVRRFYGPAYLGYTEWLVG
jgi:hypothetical protein